MIIEAKSPLLKKIEKKLPDAIVIFISNIRNIRNNILAKDDDITNKKQKNNFLVEWLQSKTQFIYSKVTLTLTLKYNISRKNPKINTSLKFLFHEHVTELLLQLPRLCIIFPRK